MSKTANLLADGYARPSRIGLALPLHWQLVCFLLGGVAAGAEVSVGDLAGCTVAFVSPDQADAALDAGVDDVLVVSGHPLGARLPSVPALCLDAAVEVPSYGDHFGGPFAGAARVLLDGEPFTTPDLGLTPSDRVLTTLPPAADGLGVLLASLTAGASLVLVPGEGDLTAIAAAERVTRTFTA